MEKKDYYVYVIRKLVNFTNSNVLRWKKAKPNLYEAGLRKYRFLLERQVEGLNIYTLVIRYEGRRVIAKITGPDYMLMLLWITVETYKECRRLDKKRFLAKLRKLKKLKVSKE